LVSTTNVTNIYKYTLHLFSFTSSICISEYNHLIELGLEGQKVVSHVVLRPVGMLFELSMVVEMQVGRWLIKNELVFFTRINLWIDMKNSRSSQSCKKNIG